MDAPTTTCRTKFANSENLELVLLEHYSNREAVTTVAADGPVLLLLMLHYCYIHMCVCVSLFVTEAFD